MREVCIGGRCPRLAYPQRPENTDRGIRVRQRCRLSPRVRGSPAALATSFPPEVGECFLGTPRPALPSIELPECDIQVGTKGLQCRSSLLVLAQGPDRSPDDFARRLVHPRCYLAGNVF